MRKIIRFSKKAELQWNKLALYILMAVLLIIVIDFIATGGKSVKWIVSVFIPSFGEKVESVYESECKIKIGFLAKSYVNFCEDKKCSEGSIAKTEIYLTGEKIMLSKWGRDAEIGYLVRGTIYLNSDYSQYNDLYSSGSSGNYEEFVAKLNGAYLSTEKGGGIPRICRDTT